MEHTQHPVEEPHMHDGFTRPLMLVWDHLLRTVYVDNGGVVICWCMSLFCMA